MLSEQIVKQVIAELLDVDEEGLTAALPLASIEGWDSVNALRVLVYLERELGGALDFDQYMKAERLGDLMGLSQAKTGTAGGSTS
jgi:acyl carrier protein